MNLLKIYTTLRDKYAPQGWWPIFIKETEKESKSLRHGLTYGGSYKSLAKHKSNYRDPYFEIAIGAILAQSAAWTNVAKAIINLYQAKALTPQRILKLEDKELEKLIYPAGYFRQKARKVKTLAKHLTDHYQGSVNSLKVNSIPDLREELLSLWGIGHETADSIMLYALNLPVFMIDEYTRRMCKIYGIECKKYDEYKEYFEKRLTREFFTKNKQIIRTPNLTTFYQEFHALIVASGQEKHKILIPRKE